MQIEPDSVDRAIARLIPHGAFRCGDRVHTVAFLLRKRDWRPLRAPWWRGKEVYIIGADLDGNFFLRHCDGSVRLWIHKSQTDEILARSVKEFAGSIE